MPVASDRIGAVGDGSSMVRKGTAVSGKWRFALITLADCRLALTDAPNRAGPTGNTMMPIASTAGLNVRDRPPGCDRRMIRVKRLLSRSTAQGAQATGGIRTAWTPKR